MKVLSVLLTRRTFDEQAKKRHNPEQIVRKLCDADSKLNAGKGLTAVLQALEGSESSYLRWRNKYGGMKS
tara:strand:+ start:2493 stop:2702 length:210 start_codon:yes stop_codon:yes gene_type:complete